jgi:hypothetical protein
MLSAIQLQTLSVGVADHSIRPLPISADVERSIVYKPKRCKKKGTTWASSPTEATFRWIRLMSTAHLQVCQASFEVMALLRVRAMRQRMIHHYHPSTRRGASWGITGLLSLVVSEPS